jgi:hypothetical protein
MQIQSIMKAKLLRAGTFCLLILTAACAVPARAEGSAAANLTTYSGTISAVNEVDKIVTVHGWLRTKKFVLADNCVLSTGEKRDLALADLRPGQKVEVSYKDASGVLVASRITQEKLQFTGEVAALDHKNRTLTVRQGGTTRVFALGDNCNVLLSGNNKGTLEDVKVGGQVTVTYETPQNVLLARTIAQKSALYVGTLSAINLPDRTVSADKRFLGDKRFHLADNCTIVVNGKTGGRLNDLRLGQNYELSYDTVYGVNIVNRIAPASTTEKNEAGPAVTQNKD